MAGEATSAGRKERNRALEKLSNELRKACRPPFRTNGAAAAAEDASLSVANRTWLIQRLVSEFVDVADFGSVLGVLPWRLLRRVQRDARIIDRLRKFDNLVNCSHKGYVAASQA